MDHSPLSKITTILVMCVLSNNASALTCERTTRSTEGFKTSAAFDAWHPKIITGAHSDSLVWKEAGKGSKALVAELEIGFNKLRYRLLPDGKMIAKVVPRARYADTANVRYKCDKTSHEVRQVIAGGSSKNQDKKASPSSSTPTTAASTSKLDNAKSTCTKLGFTLGTEKHGDCVLKMIDN